MKLSDAAVLGAATWERTCFPDTRFSDHHHGCFLQLALRAIGYSATAVCQSDSWAQLAKKEWPWIGEWLGEPEEFTHCYHIWGMNDDGATFEQILAYVRQHEPDEAQQATLDVLSREIERQKQRIEESWLEMKAGTDRGEEQ